jgi:orotidine-5'-phosphate decarboxylase
LTETVTPFARRLHEAINRKKSPLVVGLDPRLDRLPRVVIEAARAKHGAHPTWRTLALKTFCFGVLEAVESHAPAVKVNIAFFEQHHLPGLLAYAAVVAEARRRGFLVIGDIKRADIGSTAEAYAAGHLGPAPDGASEALMSLTVDAVTVNPYLGIDGVRPFINAAVANGRGVYVLVRTSNPSSVDLQQLATDSGRVSGHVADLVSRWGEEAGLTDGYAPVGAVVGATFPEELAQLRQRMPHTPLLVPGFGAQGGRVEDVGPAFAADGRGAVINASRSVIFAHQDRPHAEDSDDGWKSAVEDAARQTARELEAVRHGSP